LQSATIDVPLRYTPTSQRVPSTPQHQAAPSTPSPSGTIFILSPCPYIVLRPIGCIFSLRLSYPVRSLPFPWSRSLLHISLPFALWPRITRLSNTLRRVIARPSTPFNTRFRRLQRTGKRRLICLQGPLGPLLGFDRAQGTRANTLT